jgi:exodeoxyribonuclease-5
MDLSKEQKEVHDSILDWLTPPCYRRSITVAGYAGTGKTTLLVSLRKSIHKKNPNFQIAFCTFTGRASAVLREKLAKENCEYSQDFIGTIHKLIYRPIYKFSSTTGKKVIIRWDRISFLPYDMIIIDEASMVDSEMFKDLLFYGLPILAVGDHGQLEPVSVNKSIILNNPDFVLEKIHRQAENNPIIRLSQEVRETGKIKFGVYSPGVFKIPFEDKKCQELLEKADYLDPAMIVLCGMNKTRVGFTEKIRKRLGFSRVEPYTNERLICLKNNHTDKIMNGQLGTLMWLLYENEELYNITIQMDGFPDPFESVIFPNCFGMEKYDQLFSNMDWQELKEVAEGKTVNFFDYGYVVSVHRSQGSEFDKVIMIEERSSYWDDEYFRKWLYTGVTRAKEKLFVVGFE